MDAVKDQEVDVADDHAPPGVAVEQQAWRKTTDQRLQPDDQAPPGVDVEQWTWRKTTDQRLQPDNQAPPGVAEQWMW